MASVSQNTNFFIGIQDLNVVFNDTIDVSPKWKIGFASSYRFPTKPHLVSQAWQFRKRPPFIKPIELFQVTSSGGEYHNNSLGLCISIPEGAVPMGTVLTLEVGMCLYGPFQFPGNLIAPILMLCPQEAVQLQKPIAVTLPHILDKIEDGDLEAFDIQVIKADHTSLFYHTRCLFDTVSCNSDLFFHTDDDMGYATILLRHFCFVSLRTSCNREIAMKKGYCICSLVPQHIDLANDFDCQFLVTYFMAPCFRAIDEHYEPKRYKRTKISNKFTLKGSEALIEAKLGTVDNGWAVCLDAANEDGVQIIKEEAVDLWSRDPETFELEIHCSNYPPSFQVLVDGQQARATTFLKIHFKISQQRNDDFSMTLALRCEAMRSANPLGQNVNSDKLQCEIQQQDRPIIAGFFDNVELYLDALGLTDGERTDVRQAALQYGTQIGMIRCLECWHRHNPSAATFGSLIGILHAYIKKDKHCHED